ncbi:carbohydrate binding domain-containing protein, partial [Candidatus Woesearchaeota archaeon]|nr:carbohydrate binding domain-containing protein [Candidatus Woesearchaeota archaeon]
KVNLDYIGLQSSLSHNLDLSATPKSEPYNFVYYGDFESFSLFNPISLNTASAINNINNFMTYTDGVGTHSLISDSTHGKVLSIIKSSGVSTSLIIFNNKLAKITLTPGKKYKISLDAKAITPTSCLVSFSILTDFQDPPGSGNWNSYEPILSNCAITNQWTTCAKEAVYSGPSVANSVADSARIRTPNIVSSTCTSYYLDNIQFYQIN